VFKPAPMVRIDILMLETDLDATTRVLGRLGVLHLTPAYDRVRAEPMRSAEADQDVSACTELLGRIRSLCAELDVRDTGRTVIAPVQPVELVRAQLDAIEQELRRHQGSLEQIGTQRQKIEQVLAGVEPFLEMTVPVERVRDTSFLHFAVGSLSARSVDRFEQELGRDVVALPLSAEKGGPVRLIVAGPQKSRWAIETAMDTCGFRREDFGGQQGLPSEIHRAAAQQLETLRRQGIDTRHALAALVEKHRAGLLGLWRRTTVEEQILNAQTQFGKTWATCLISGWMPEARVDTVQQAVAEATHGRAVIEIRRPDQLDDPPETIPVLMDHSPLWRPFGRLVSGYGFPTYREVEPTLLVGVTFLLMFGLMFGDVGHGLVLVLIGLMVRRLGRSDVVRDFGTLACWAGGASMVAGVLYGAVFGAEYEWALWLSPMHDTLRLLISAVLLGVGVISLGLVINIINRLRSRDYFQGILDKFGVVGAVFYWGALGLGLKAAILGHVTTWEIVLVIGLPLGVLFLREPIYNLMTRKDRLYPHGVLSGLMEASVDVLETFMVYLANTASFARVGAFALSHAGLCAAVFAMERIVRMAPGGVLWSVLLLVVGNAFVIALEGLIVGIQCTRLEYYEFFSKFFSGSGTRHRPLTLVGRNEG